MKTCPRCKNFMLDEDIYCRVCGNKYSSQYVQQSTSYQQQNVQSEPSSGGTAFVDKQALVENLRKLYVDFSTCNEIRDRILHIKAQRRAFSDYFMRFFWGSLIGALLLTMLLTAAFPSLSSYSVEWVIISILAIGLVLGAAASHNLSKINKEMVESQLVEPYREVSEAFNRVNQRIGMVPTQYRYLQYIKYLADVIEIGQANSMYEAIQFLQWEIDKPRREYEQKRQELERRTRELDEKYLREAEWLYYIEPRGKN